MSWGGGDFRIVKTTLVKENEDGVFLARKLKQEYEAGRDFGFLKVMKRWEREGRVEKSLDAF